MEERVACLCSSKSLRYFSLRGQVGSSEGWRKTSLRCFTQHIPGSEPRGVGLGPPVQEEAVGVRAPERSSIHSRSL